MLALAVSCETMYGPVQTPIASDEKKADGVEITVTEAKDESVIFTLAPKAESAYYSYMVHQANEAVEVDAQSLYSGAYKGKAGVVKTGSFKWTAETAVSTVAVNGLNPNTTYQIYAVAATPMGFVGQVANASFKTSDTVVPELVDYEAEDNVVTLIFNESVVRGEGALTAGIYAMNSAEIETGVAVGSVTVAEENIVVEGNTVTVTVANLPAGAFYGLNFPEGAFKDPSNNKAAALESAVVFGEDTGYEPEYYGAGGRNATNTFALGQIEDEKYASPKAPSYLLTFDSEYGYGYTYSEAYGKAVYTIGNKTTEYTLTGNKDYGYAEQYNGVVLTLPASGDPGNKVRLTIEEGAFEDYYGNFNAEWTDELIYSYGYTLDDITGTYNFSAPDNVSQKYVSGTMVIENSDKPEKGNVMITTFADVPCIAPIYANFNFDAGTLSIAHSQAFYQYTESENKITYVFYTYEGAGVTLSMPSAGTLAGPDDYFGIAYAVNGKLTDFVALFLDFEAEKAAPASGTAKVQGLSTLPSIKDTRLEVEIKKF